MKSLVKWYPFIIMIAIDQAFAISNIFIKKIVSDGVDHLVFISYRQTVSAIFLSPLAFFVERGSRPKLTLSILCHLFLSALIGISVTQYLFLLGVEYTSATFACAFLNIVPILTFLMALPFSLETLNIKYSSGKAKVVGSVVCVGGAILLISYKGIPLFHFSDHPQRDTRQHINLNSHSNRERWAVGSVALFGGTLCWSSWFLIQTNIGKRYPCQYSSTAIMASFSAIQSAIISFSVERELSKWILKAKSDIFIVIYTGMVGSGLCFVGMSWCVKKRGPVFTAAFSPFVQIMAATFEVPFLHEQQYLGSLIGSAVTIIGLYILLWGKDQELQNPEIKEMKEQEQEFQVVKVSLESERP